MKQSEALDIMYAGHNVFLTGDAGTGKTWTTNEFIQSLRLKGKTVIVTAPTGVAAINIGGATLHSTFKVFGMYPEQKNVRSQKISWNQVDAVVLDEISMVGPDMLDQIDYVLRSCAYFDRPFGGIQMILVGDAAQLKPVYAPHTSQDKLEYKKVLLKYNNKLTFDYADAFRDGQFKTCHLTEARRQKEPEFLQALNLIRDGFDQVLEKFNAGVGDGDTVHLMPTNDMVNEYNDTKYRSLHETERVFYGHINGDFNLKNAITPLELKLKKGCRVMITKNNAELGVVNGDTGYIDSMSDSQIGVRLDRFDDVYYFARETWKQIEYYGSEEVEIGSFTQFPIKLAWAITIHKSQGLTLDNVCVHVTKGMQKELLYVGISRASTVEKLFINRR